MTRPGDVVLGIVRVARGRPDGLGRFGDTPAAFMASLAPLVAFPLVGAVGVLLRGSVVPALTGFAAAMCVLLVPAVLSHWLARRWDREAGWLRYATAFNWCQWAMPLALVAAWVALAVLTQAGLPPEAAEPAALLALGMYGCWLHWFLARYGLGLSRLRAVAMVVLVDLGTGVVLFLPLLRRLAAGAVP